MVIKNFVVNVTFFEAVRLSLGFSVPSEVLLVAGFVVIFRISFAITLVAFVMVACIVVFKGVSARFLLVVSMVMRMAMVFSVVVMVMMTRTMVVFMGGSMSFIFVVSVMMRMGQLVVVSMVMMMMMTMPVVVFM